MKRVRSVELGHTDTNPLTIIRLIKEPLQSTPTRDMGEMFSERQRLDRGEKRYCT